ncbi:NACHT domain-containing protein [Promicromonospora sp. NPDC057138]|uniref:NACHT domain-containing protein n=1 Tax=Promicromonospora sp. NPDC057138 TaxID=3346031 RepID=UPI003642944E
MDYDLHRLGPREFEHLVQALAREALGPLVGTFGDGPDGGREASWDGPAPAQAAGALWDGYGVLQAKARRDIKSVSDNLKWFKSEMEKELSLWKKPDGNRHRVPEFYLLATNVRLSAHPDAGIDEANRLVEGMIRESELGIKGFRIWHYDDIRVSLDRNQDIRRSFAAFTTPGDVLARLLDTSEHRRVELKNALYAHAARTLLDDNALNLTQAGSAADTPMTVAEVFTDVPVATDRSVEEETEEWEIEEVRNTQGAIPLLIGKADASYSDTRAHESQRRTVLLGGPGQGKSTVTQYLALVYRASLLKGTRLAAEADIAPAIESINSSLAKLGVAPPNNRRWPIRIVMTKLADALNSGSSPTLLEFIASQVSSRGSVVVDASEMRYWLKEYPWLLLIDGLDEVPPSSNRDQVLESIRDFFFDATQLGGDVVTIATTRPQGYSHEFDPNQYEHLVLTPLESDAAVRFASSFIALRSGAHSERSADLIAKFERAAQDSATSRLLGSPLQVTIMVVLLERLGQAPRDRWRLFNSYYRVIFQREQQKEGELAELLRRHENDIDHIHRRVGFLLQERSAEAGETSSALSKDDLNDLIKARLRDQGYDEQSAVNLTAKFASLATDRLVFLASVRADTIAFEIRSLQEFMAAEFIIGLPERDIPEHLQSVAAHPHWRNVILFAAGKIFAERDVLKDSIIVLCEYLDLATGSTGLPRTGAEIALGVLQDGACETQPRYERLLAARALTLLDIPPLIDAEGIAHLCATSPTVEALALERLESWNLADEAASANRIMVLGALADRRISWARVSLGRAIGLFSEANLVSISNAVEFERWDSLRGAISSRVAEMSVPGAIEIVRGSRRFRGSFRNDDGSASTWYDAFAATTLPFAIEARPSGPLFREGGPRQIDAGIRRLNHGRAIWERVIAALPTGDEWQAFGAIGAFQVSPTAASLASALRKLASIGRTGWVFRMGSTISWPLSAALESARFAGEASPSNVLAALADAADAGELGELSDWEAAEAKWFAAPALGDILEPAPRGSRSGIDYWLPVWPGIREGALPFEALDLVYHFPSSDEDRDATMRSLDRLLDLADSWGDSSSATAIRSYCANIVGNIVHTLMPEIGSYESEDVREASVDALRLIDRITIDSLTNRVGGYTPLSWFGLFDTDELLARTSISALDELGRRRRLSVESFGYHASQCISDWLAAPEKDGLLRLAIHLDVGTAVRLIREWPLDVQRLLKFCSPELVSFVRCITTGAEAVSRGDVDADLGKIGVGMGADVSGDRDSIYGALQQALVFLPVAERSALGYRASKLAARSDVYTASQFFFAAGREMLY